MEAPSGERLQGKGWHGVLCRLKAVWSMPERFKVVCIPCKALYKCSALPFLPRQKFWHWATIQRKLHDPSLSHFATMHSCHRRRQTDNILWHKPNFAMKLELRICRNLESDSTSKRDITRHCEMVQLQHVRYAGKARQKFPHLTTL